MAPANDAHACAGGRAAASERHVYPPDHEDIGAGGTVADGPIGNYLSHVVPDTASADEVERREAVDVDVFGEELRARPNEPRGTQDDLILLLPRSTVGTGDEPA